MPKLSLSFEAKLIFILSVLVAFGPMSIDMYLPAFTAIATDFKVDMSLVQYTLASFNVGIALGQLFYGPLSDQFGRKNILLSGMLIYIVASIGCALVVDIDHMIYLRFLQAIGGCAGMVTARAVVRDTFDGNQAARVFSTMMLIMGVAPIVAPTLGGLALLYFNWRFIFWFLGVLSTVALVAVYFYLPETLPSDKRTPHATKRSLSTYYAIFHDKLFVGYALSAGLLQGAMFAYITGSSFAFVELFNFTEQQYGLIFGLNACGLIATSQLNRFLLQKFTYNKILLRAFILNFLAALTLFVCATTGTFSIYGITVPLFFMVSTMGVVFPNSSVGSLAHQSARAGSASALLGTIMFTCGALAAFSVSFLYDKTILPMVSVILICSSLGLLTSFWLRSNLIKNNEPI
ncbi:MAG: Bcr/CflA family multidrug efflux MFS transporter [Bdellovibrionales bacterium]|nr:Bcr/CflA family multidrug efflux MFS transporter [Bdellovibrionales bacterium]